MRLGTRGEGLQIGQLSDRLIRSTIACDRKLKSITWRRPCFGGVLTRHLKQSRDGHWCFTYFTCKLERRLHETEHHTCARQAGSDESTLLCRPARNQRQRHACRRTAENRRGGYAIRAGKNQGVGAVEFSLPAWG